MKSLRSLRGTEPLVDEVGQPATDFCPPPPRQSVLHAQVDRQFWHLRVARVDGPIDDTGSGATNTPEWFTKSAAELIARNAIGGVVFHVPPDTQFGNIAGYLKNAIELNQRAGYGNVRRAIDFHEGEKINEAAFKALSREAIAANVAAVAARAKKKG